MYEISRYVEGEDEDPGRWRVWARRKTKRATVRQIQRLQSMGYDRNASIYVEQTEGKP